MSKRPKRKNSIKIIFTIIVLGALVALTAVLFYLYKDYIFPSEPALEHFFGN